MGEITHVPWCDHTFNGWIGCYPISEGCAHCYAERENKRFNWVGKWGKEYKLTRPANWLQPLAWARKAVAEEKLRRVFMFSLGDVLDIDVPPAWRDDLWSLIDEIGEINHPFGYGLEVLLLTKRIENIGLLPARWLQNPPRHVRLGITAENQDRFDERMPRLLHEWLGHNFVSYEPALGEIDFFAHMPRKWTLRGHDHATEKGRGIDWLICGCESGPLARPMNLEWARIARDQCQSYGVPFFFKQANFDGIVLTDPLLDGQTWRQFPEIGR